uniref:Uncharacterized protein n=1 Tax=Mimivirus LCMiAC02 TaxID=2506609 RepID=A0A4P6VP66_9VIRU|nr:MAG: hypothetical protein LCMiAC02_04630 [Mimivirus LCMiAC02]
MNTLDQIKNSVVTILVALAFYGCYRLCIKAYSIYVNHRRWNRMTWIAKIMTIYCGTAFAFLGIAEMNRLYNIYSYKISDVMRNVSTIICKLNNFENSIGCMTQINKTTKVNDNLPQLDMTLIKGIMNMIRPVGPVGPIDPLPIPVPPIKENILHKPVPSVQVPIQEPVSVPVPPVSEPVKPVQVNPIIGSPDIKNNLDFCSNFPLDLDAITKIKTE